MGQVWNIWYFMNWGMVLSLPLRDNMHVVRYFTYSYSFYGIRRFSISKEGHLDLLPLIKLHLKYILFLLFIFSWPVIIALLSFRQKYGVPL